MKYDPASKQVEVLVSNLAFPNGVALSKDGCSILLAETTSCRILRYWIKTSKSWNPGSLCSSTRFPRQHKKEPLGEDTGSVYIQKERSSRSCSFHIHGWGMFCSSFHLT
ncbi:hypothetical protein OIU84_011626 [Salix udensis]|uniref:Strictosidine synthase conserved region domain-containing protein n=1 Tax=Salix udensis TaxID=889485 RepID=A0AAD6JP25_9ROSI|nr:hypothetical protein OIU84_011626 [Salix udensis]